MWTFLLLVLGVVAVAALVWNFRRQAAAREAASAERMKAFLEQARAEAGTQTPPAPPTPPANATAADASAAAKPVRLVPSAPLTGFALRVPMLNADQQALYLLLKSALPDHVIFASVSLAAFIQSADNITGFAREAQERRLTDAVADFVVCDPSMKPVAAVQCGARNGKAAETAAFAAACAAATGVRWVAFTPQALPQPQALRQQVPGA